MGRILKICGNTWENASRDKRELSVYQELGNEVLVIAKGLPDDRGRVENVDGFKVLRYTTRPLGSSVPDFINRFLSLFIWAKAAKILKPDVISGHDLLPGLLVAWMSTWFMCNKPKLIYDSHEFELGRNTGRKRGKFRLLAISVLERFLMKRCIFSIMVNDSIADEVQKIYKLKKRPVVIRSTPSYWQVNKAACMEIRDEFVQQIKKPKVNCFFVIYHGAIVKDRGIETLIRILELNKNVCGIILGDGKEKYMESLKGLAKSLGVDERLVFHGAVSIDELWKYVGAADVSLMMIGGESKSYYMSLPNKFFESIQAETPIIASDFPEMKKMIERYGIGLTCNPRSLSDINRCVEKVRCNKDLYYKYKKNIRIAKKELCWEKEKEVLQNALTML